MSPGWRKIERADYSGAEAFLRARESLCVGACSRFLNANSDDHVWTLSDERGETDAFLLHSRRSLYPVFSKVQDLPIPRFLSRFLRKVPIHMVQGNREDAEILEKSMEDLGYCAEDRIDYDLMNLDKGCPMECFHQGPPGLILRVPVPEDTEELFRLHAAYEQEEVIPQGSIFDPGNSRKSLRRILEGEQMLIACLDDQIVGKINTNAKSFTRYQIGGVYVLPGYRNQGIAVRMTAEFIQKLLLSVMGITLFVKKRNAAARSVYRRLGFNICGDYRISYF